MGLYLEVIYLLLCSFYDKFLTIYDRMVNLSTIKTVITLWREALGRLKCLGKHFITNETWDDTIVQLRDS